MGADVIPLTPGNRQLLTVTVASDHPGLAARVVRALSADAIDVGSETDTVRKLGPCDVAVVAATNGLGEQLAGVARELPLVVVLVEPKPPQIRKLLRAGARGVVIADRLEQTLAPSVRSVAAGQITVDAEFGRQLERPALSTREKQVLAMVVMGLGNQEIANRLYLTESTVKSHLSSAFGKLGVKSRYEAAAMIMDPEQALGPGILHITGAVPGPAGADA